VGIRTRTRARGGRALAGIAGPVAFTAAWVWSSTHQEPGYTITREHLSGLAAPDAVHPEVMVGGFLVLGACTAVFAGALEDALGGRAAAGAGPTLLRVAGLATIAAGLLRRDRMLLGLPEGVERQSWRNDGHDVASGVIYTCLGFAPLVLARRFRADPAWAPLRGPALVGSAASAVVMALFASKAVEPVNGLLQRAAVTGSLASLAGLALWTARASR
jgi:hypothetical protein